MGNSQDIHDHDSSKHRIKRIDFQLQHHYDSLKQVHDYSNNWDFDGDSIADQLFFIGTGGAHLYFYPRIILSSDHIIIEFRRIETDFPVLQVGERSEDRTSFLERLIGFAIFENGNNERRVCNLVIRLDRQSKTAYYYKYPERHSDILIITFNKILKVKEWN